VVRRVLEARLRVPARQVLPVAPPVPGARVARESAALLGPAAAIATETAMQGLATAGTVVVRLRVVVPLRAVPPRAAPASEQAAPRLPAAMLPEPARVAGLA
jgi:hypothetical protein